MIHVFNYFSSSLGKTDESANISLAKQIVSVEDNEAIKELIQLLQSKNKRIQHDCIKVLYEIGYLSPIMIAAYYLDFITLLTGKDNRVQWGAMTALDAILLLQHEAIFPLLPQLIAIAEQGSVITRDKCIAILIKYLSLEHEDVFPLLHEQLLKCPPNQLPMYAEQALKVIPRQYKTDLSKMLTNRLDGVEKESKKTRIRKVIKKLQE